MVLHLPHAEGDFGVTFNDVTKDATFYTTTWHFVAWLGTSSQERQTLWIPKDDLQDSSSWPSSPLVLLRDIHNNLLANYDCQDTTPPQSQTGTGSRVGRIILDWSLSLLLVCFTSLVDNYLVTEVH